MSILELLWRYKAVGLLVLLVSAYVASWRLRRERPDVEALRKFVFAAASLLSGLAVIGFILWHLTEFGTPGEVMLVIVALDAVSRFHAVLDRWKELRSESKGAPEAVVERLAKARVGEPDLKAVPPAVGKEGGGEEASQSRTRLAPNDAERGAAEQEAAEQEANEEGAKKGAR